MCFIKEELILFGLFICHTSKGLGFDVKMKHKGVGCWFDVKMKHKGVGCRIGPNINF